MKQPTDYGPALDGTVRAERNRLVTLTNQYRRLCWLVGVIGFVAGFFAGQLWPV